MKKKKIMIQCASATTNVKRETIDGAEHVIISSFTLPDNIVMNGGFYSAEEIHKSFLSLERTLAPVEHPQDSNGNYISASDPLAIHNFHAGAFNINVRQENGRIAIDKAVNVNEALKTERGRHLMDRINEIETSDNPRPIHTSVGVFLTSTELDEPKVNADGKEYTWIASDMVFDHDAILLNSVGAAQPGQGVGMGINADGNQVDVETFVLNADVPPEKELSHENIHSMLYDAIRTAPINGDWVSQVFSNTFIFEVDEKLFSAPYIIDNGSAKIVGIPLPVERDVTFKFKNNSRKGDEMKDMIVNALTAANIEIKDLTDAQLFEKYNELLANESGEPGDGDDDAESDGDTIASAVTNALAPVVAELNAIKAQLNTNTDAELAKYAGIVTSSDKYPGLDVDSAKLLGVEKLKEMAANCVPAHGVPFTNVNDSGDDASSIAPVDMPE